MFTITADSEPKLDNWGWDDYWSKEDWQKWHNLMVKKYGAPYAKEKFLYWWNQQDSLANPYNWAKYDKNFVSYLDKYGIDISSIVSSVLVAGEKVVKNTSETAAKSSGVIKTIIPLLLITGTVFVIYVAYQNRNLILKK